MAVVGRVGVAVDDLALGAHTAGVDAAVEVVLTVLIADVDGQGAVVVHRGLGAGVGVVLHGRGVAVKARGAAFPALCAAVGIGRQVGAGEQGGRAHLQAGAAGAAGGGGAVPVAFNGAPIAEELVITKAARADHGLVGDEQELGHELDAHLAGDPQGLAVELLLGAVRQIGPGEEAVGRVGGQLAEQADLQGQDGVVEAEAAEGVQIAVDPQGGEVVVHRVGLLGLVGPGGQGVRVLLVGVDRGGLVVQLQGDARAEGAGDGDGAHPGVDIGLEADAGAGGEAAADGPEAPLALLGVVVELPLVVALQLGAEVQVVVGPAHGVGGQGVGGVIGAGGHLPQLVHRGDAEVQLRLHQLVVHGEAAIFIVEVREVQAVVAAPDDGVEHRVVLRRGDEDLEQRRGGAADNVLQHPADVAGKGVADLVALVADEVELTSAAADALQEAALHLRHHRRGVLIDQLHLGQVDDPEGHGHLFDQGAVLVHAGPQGLGGLGL